MSDPSDQPQPRAALSSKVVLAVAGVNLLATAGLAALVVLRGPGAAAAPAAPAAAAAAGEHDTAPAADKAAAPAAEKAAGEAAAPAPSAGADKPKEASGAAAADAPSNTARLEDIVIHLRNPEVDRYARLTIDVEMTRSDDLRQLQDNVPRVRDAIILTLSAYTFEELRGPEGLGRMKIYLRDAIDKVVPGDVSAVYISTFLVQ
jgi:flagellar basal body-associated protein FliL